MSSNHNLAETLAQLGELSLTVQNHLLDEQAALTERDADKISKASHDKQRAVIELNNYTTKFNLALKNLGYDKKSSVDKFLIDQVQNKTIVSLWQQCKATVKTCDTINRVNSGLVSSGIKQTMLTLDFLTESIHGEPDRHYDKSGIHTNKVSYGMNIKA